eukprot:gb/GFBE01078644.1/.p1 GENE.gb/GFBE01078644.1/~~gb/GFBE01078644.1/.p1  ORF type:complete len:403 (+),score=87.52 gb/GFBE01078644.1/:1-1209(+)
MGGSCRSWLGAVLSLCLWLVAHRYSSGWAAPSFLVLILACAYIWCLVLRVPHLSKELTAAVEVLAEEKADTAEQESEKSTQTTTGPVASTPAPASPDIVDADHEPWSQQASSTIGNSVDTSTRKQPAVEEAAEEAAEGKGTLVQEDEQEVKRKESASNGVSQVVFPDASQDAQFVEQKRAQESGSGNSELSEQKFAMSPKCGAESNETESRHCGILDDISDPARAQQLRLEGNEHFKAGRLHDAREAYSEALHLSPHSEVTGSDVNKDRAALHCNRAACFQKLARWEDVVTDCSLAIEFDPEYAKAYLRRSNAYEELKRWHDAAEDLKKTIEIEPALRAKESRRLAMLEQRAQEQFDKDKDDMLAKLKDLGNTVLGKFGMSTDNFKMEQDPNTGSYSLKFQS